MNDDEIKNLVVSIATELAHKGPGWAQEGVVLREVRDRMAKKGALEINYQQRVLNAWHDLFMDKEFAWGYDLDNPSSPFFHKR